MMRKKFLFPFLTLAVAAAFTLGACGSKPSGESQGGGSGDVSDSEVEEVKINITSEGDKKEIIVGETLQLTADQEGVTWGTRNTDIVSVSSTGLVTALATGSARITAEKEGFARGSFTLTVNKAPEKPAKYTLHMEDADHYSPNDDKWGMNYGGQWMGPNADGDSPIEEGGGSDGTHLGWLQSGCKETLTFTANKAVQVEIGVSMAYNAEMDLSTVMTVTFNGADISMAGRKCEAPLEEGSYYEFNTVSFGNVTLNNGNNVLVITMIAQGPNLDDFKIYTEEDIEIAVVKPTVLPRIEATPASVTLEIGQTQQITTVTEGVAYTSDHPEIAEVSATGLVTAKAAGNAEITVSKEGMKPATVSVRVKQPRETVAYDLVAGTTVRMEAEAGEFYCDAGTWGQDMSGNWSGPDHDNGETPIEDEESASGGMSLGYFNQTSKVTLKFNSPKAGTIAIKLCGANAADFDLAAGATIKVNDTALDLTGKVVTGGGENAYYNWVVVDLGNAAVNNGANTLSLEILASQGFNIDYFDVTLA